MKLESPYSPFRFMREWQYAWTEYFAFMQGALVGAAEVRVAKAGVWDFIKSLPQKFLGRLADRPNPPTIHIDVGLGGADYSEADRETHRWLHDNWNEVYQSENYKGSVLGMIAKEMQSRGVDLNVLKDMTLEDLGLRMQAEGYDEGLDNVDEYIQKSGWKKSQYYAHIWAKTKGAEWLAVYDQAGNRAGRAYEVVTQMYRDVIAKAIADNVPPDKIRQRLLFADDNLIKQEFMRGGKLDEAAYQEFIDLHLNRDMVRFAVTETAYAFNNGKLLQTLHEGGEYVRFIH